MKRVEKKRRKIFGFVCSLFPISLLLSSFFRICFVSFAQISGNKAIAHTHTHTVNEVANDTTAHANQVYQHFMYAQKNGTWRIVHIQRIEQKRRDAEFMILLTFRTFLFALRQSKTTITTNFSVVIFTTPFGFSQTFFGASLFVRFACVESIKIFTGGEFCNWFVSILNSTFGLSATTRNPKRWDLSFEVPIFSASLTKWMEALLFAAGQISRGSGRVRTYLALTTMTHRRQSS